MSYTPDEPEHTEPELVGELVTIEHDLGRIYTALVVVIVLLAGIVTVLVMILLTL